MPINCFTVNQPKGDVRMLLQEALQELKNGARLYRKGWNIQDGYVVLLPGMKHVWKIVLQPQPNAGNFIFSFEDLCADDWSHFVSEEEAKPCEPESSEASVEL
jgi:hypothetical protein